MNNKIKSDVLKIAIPSLIVALFDQLFAVIDTMLIGTISDKTVYVASLATINVSTRIVLFIQALTQGTNIAATTIYSRYMGKNDKEKMQSTLLHTIFINVFVLTLPTIIICLLFTKQIMTFIGTDKIVYDVGKGYYIAILIGFVFCSFNNIISFLIRACGESKKAMVCEVSSSVFNIVFDLLLINGFWIFPKLGVTGAGIATGGSYVFLFILYSLILLKSNSKLKIDFKQKFYFNKDMIKNILKIGIPVSFESLALKGSNIFYTKIISFAGIVVLAAQQICITIYGLFAEIGGAVAISVTPLVSESLGKKDKNIAKKYVKYGVFLAIKISLIASLIFILLNNPILNTFTKVVEVKEQVKMVLIFVLLSQFSQNIRDVYAAGLRGAGDTTYNAKISCIFDVILKLILSYIFVCILGLGLVSIWIIVFVTESIKILLYYSRLNSNKLKIIKLK